MKFRGGYNFNYHGKPDGLLEDAACPDVLYLPLKSKSYNFTALKVAHGQDVGFGEVLARDPENYDIPLLSPYSGKVDLEKTPGHITLEALSGDGEVRYSYLEKPEHVPEDTGPEELKRYKILNLGAWEFIRDVYTGRIPDPVSIPRAIIVSTLHLEPFLIRGDVLLKEHMRQFTLGLEHIQSMLEYQPIYLVLPRVNSDLSSMLKNQIRGYAWVRLIEVPLKYPYDHFALISRHIGLKPHDGSVWGINIEGVLAIDKVLTNSRPCVERIISIAGPAAGGPLHLRLTAGYPLSKIEQEYAESGSITIDGGMLTGRLLDENTKGLPSDCSGITFIPGHTGREFLGWLRPGLDRRSYSASFVGSLCSFFPQRITDALRGEVRPCVSCGFCEEVCPAGIIPHRLHKLIYQDDIDAVEKFRLDLCIECGLCSFVCPSKIELLHQFREMKKTISKEKEIAAAKAAREKESESQAETG